MMEDATTDHWDYCKNLIKTHDYPRYLQCHLVKGEAQKRALAYYALDAELQHVHHHVSEEMIGHIRYAWWREAMDQLGAPHQQHPVLRALYESRIEVGRMIALVDTYREAYPEMPATKLELPMGDAGWEKAERIIGAHKGRRWWLLLKLLFI